MSPQNARVDHYQFAPKDDFMLIYGLKDTNKDGVFDPRPRFSLQFGYKPRFRKDGNSSTARTKSVSRQAPKES